MPITRVYQFFLLLRAAEYVTRFTDVVCHNLIKKPSKAFESDASSSDAQKSLVLLSIDNSDDGPYHRT